MTVKDAIIESAKTWDTRMASVVADILFDHGLNYVQVEALYLKWTGLDRPQIDELFYSADRRLSYG